MPPLLRLARAGALAPLLSCAALAAWAQAPDEGADPAPAPAALPGTVVERNVFVPVDSTGHTGGEYIVVERRVVTTGAATDRSAAAEVPTHFILVPRESGDDDDEDEDGGSQAR